MCGESPSTLYDLARGWKDGHGLMFRRLIHPIHERALRFLDMTVMNYSQDDREERYEI